MARAYVWADALLAERVGYDDGLLHHELVQPSRAVILEANKRDRLEGGPRSLSWGRVTLRIPVIDLLELRRRNPELCARDHEIKTRAWKKFAASPEAAPYRVGDKT